ncbi:MAG: hypothetical protein L0Z55_12745 [Planctomycetes bacterium]|nr:hypothetical protein [Planctomycetota bacterium]
MTSALVRDIQHACRQKQAERARRPGTRVPASEEPAAGPGESSPSLLDAINTRVHDAVERFARELDRLAAKPRGRTGGGAAESAVGPASASGERSLRLGDTQHIRYPDSTEAESKPAPPRTERLGVSSSLFRECMQHLSGVAATTIRGGLAELTQNLDEKFARLAAREHEGITPPEWIAVMRAELASLRTGVQTLLARGREEMVLIQDQDHEGGSGELGSAASGAAARIEAAVATILPLLDRAHGVAGGGESEGEGRTPGAEFAGDILSRLERIERATCSGARTPDGAAAPEALAPLVTALGEKLDRFAELVHGRLEEVRQRVESLAQGAPGSNAAIPTADSDDQELETAIAARGDALRRALDRVALIAEKNAETSDALIQRFDEVQQLVDQRLSGLSCRLDTLVSGIAEAQGLPAGSSATDAAPEILNEMRALLREIAAKVEALAAVDDGDAESGDAAAAPVGGEQDHESRKMLRSLKRDLSLLVHTLNNHFQENALLAESVASLRAALETRAAE